MTGGKKIESNNLPFSFAIFVCVSNFFCQKSLAVSRQLADFSQEEDSSLAAVLPSQRGLLAFFLKGS